MTGFVIAVLKGDDVSEKGQIIQVNDSTSIQEFKSLAAKKLEILDSLGKRPNIIILLVNILTCVLILKTLFFCSFRNFR
jgi:hypothetical protein